MDEAHVHIQPTRVDQTGDEQAKGNHDDATNQVGFLPVGDQQPADGSGAGPQRNEDGGKAQHEAQAHADHCNPLPAAFQDLQFVHRAAGDEGHVAGYQGQHAGRQERDHARGKRAEDADVAKAHRGLFPRCGSYHFLHKLNDFRAVPLGRTGFTAEFSPLAVQQQGDRQAEGAEALDGLHLLIEVDLEVLDADLPVEVPYDLQSALIERERHHLEVVAAQLGLESIQGRHFLTAGDAPGGPQVEQNHLAAEVSQAEWLPFAIDETDCIQRFGLRPDDQPRPSAGFRRWLGAERKTSPDQR
ncbi:hypothetical protein D9M69_362900 [compost metagenome]